MPGRSVSSVQLEGNGAPTTEKKKYARDQPATMRARWDTRSRGTKLSRGGLHGMLEAGFDTGLHHGAAGPLILLAPADWRVRL